MTPPHAPRPPAGHLMGRVLAALTARLPRRPSPPPELLALLAAADGEPARFRGLYDNPEETPCDRCGERLARDLMALLPERLRSERPGG